MGPPGPGRSTTAAALTNSVRRLARKLSGRSLNIPTTAGPHKRHRRWQLGGGRRTRPPWSMTRAESGGLLPPWSSTRNLRGASQRSFGPGVRDPGCPLPLLQCLRLHKPSPARARRRGHRGVKPTLGEPAYPSACDRCPGGSKPDRRLGAGAGTITNRFTITDWHLKLDPAGARPRVRVSSSVAHLPQAQRPGASESQAIATC